MSRHEPITPAQLGYIHALARQLDISKPTLNREIDNRFGCLMEELNRGQASALIDWLGAIRDGHAPRPVPPGQTTLFDLEEEE